MTLLPFAKTVSGTFGGGTRKPTNTIVDFYVEQIVNLPGQPTVVGVNGGRPYAVFRINYEDVEQGNDHDMDAIVRYEVMVNAGTPRRSTVNLSSDYAAGSANQNIGYSISGTNHDGIYLEVRDTDSAANQSLNVLNTPPGVWAGGCAGGTSTAPCNTYLGFTASRTFGSGTAGGHQAQRPAVVRGQVRRRPDLGLPTWTTTVRRTTTSWSPIRCNCARSCRLRSTPSPSRTCRRGNLGITGARVSGTRSPCSQSFNVQRNGKDWTGNLTAVEINPNGTLGDDAVERAEPAAAGRRPTAAAAQHPHQHRARPSTTLQAVQFRAANLAGTTAGAVRCDRRRGAQVAVDYGAALTPNNLIDYLRGDQAQEDPPTAARCARVVRCWATSSTPSR